MTNMSIGMPLPRIDGPAKVTGAARYAAEFDQPGQAYAVLVTSTVGLGRVLAIQTDPVERMPGVRAVITHKNAPRLAYREHKGFIDPASGERLHVLQDDLVRFYGQPVAIVVAETLDEAERAAAALVVDYDPRTPAIRSEDVAAVTPDGAHGEADHVRGDADGALAAAAFRVEATYRIARENHNPMEPHATVAAWDGDRLTLWSKSQFVVNEAAEIAAVFGLPAENVTVICPYIGGAFGTSLRTWPHVTLAAIAARAAGRPVKLALTRRQMFFATGHRPRSVQRMALGADAEGRLTALLHEGTGDTSRYEQFVEALTAVPRFLYACPNVRSQYRLAPLDISTPTYMRGPGEASGVHALECAMDELAYALGIDPVALRLRNETAVDESTNRPFSSRSLVACFERGAEAFGWARRDPRPGSMRDGNLLVGWGVASTTYPVFRAPASARARLLPDGTVEVEAAASDMGPGTYTSMTQVAADALGLAPSQIRFSLGRSDFPPTPPHGGSMTMASVGAAVQGACLAARDLALARATADPASPLHGAAPGDVQLGDGRLSVPADPSRTDTFAAIVARGGGTPIEAEASAGPGDEMQRFSMHAFGAVFAEVTVDPDLGLVRVRRVVGAYAAGRIINPRLARSQCIGGMVGGIGMALMEQTALDARDGRPVNASMADYLVPVNLDIGDLEVLFVDEEDPHVGPLGAKGLGEIALVGVAPAIANAVFHATGRRVHELPIRIEALL